MNGIPGMDRGRARLAVSLAVALALPLGWTSGVRGDPPLDPLPAPDYSFDLESPTVLEGYVAANDILGLDFPYPMSVLTSASIGLDLPGDDLDALSAGNAGAHLATGFALLFSVDRLTVGVAPPDPALVELEVPYNALDQAWRGQAAGDLFISTRQFTDEGIQDWTISDNNVLVRNNYDEGGIDYAAQPSSHAYDIYEHALQDRVDASAQLERLEPGHVIAQLYFSATADSPSLTELAPALGASGAHIFVAMEPSFARGACCYADETCELVRGIECEGGTWLGPRVPCEQCPAPATLGACCHFDGACVLTPELDCVGGSWLGPDTNCSACEPPGVCCFDGGGCEILTAFECIHGGTQGRWLGPDTTCDTCEDPMLQTGACCFDEGGCEITTMVDCLRSPAMGEGVWLGPDTTCSMCEGPAPETGACCYDDGTCDVTPLVDCVRSPGMLGGQWLGADTLCDDCPPLPEGPCCYPDETCEMTILYDCMWGAVRGDWLGPDASCDMCTFSEEGACCDPDGGCAMLDPETCFYGEGRWLGPGVPCGLCPPSDPWACCLPDGICLMLRPVECAELGGSYQFDETCAGDADGSGGDDFCEQLPPRRYLVGVYASCFELGLLDGDDIDGLIVFDFNANGRFDGNDRVLFSLAPGSASLRLGLIAGASESGGAADVFMVAPGGWPTVIASAARLGLGAEHDNIDALDFVIGIGLTSSRSPTDPLERYGIRSSCGDVNCDGQINVGDVHPFALALLDPSVYSKHYPQCDRLTADCNFDGAVDTGDIKPFLALLARHRGSAVEPERSDSPPSVGRQPADTRPGASRRPPAAP